MRYSLRQRLLTAAALSITGALILAGMFLYQMFARHVEAGAERQLNDRLRQLAALIEPGDDGNLAVTGSLADPRFGLPLSGLYWQVLKNGESIAASPSLGDHVIATQDVRRPESGPGRLTRSISGPGGEAIAVVVRDVSIAHQGVDHSLRLVAAERLSEIETAIRSFAAEMWISLGAIAVFLLIASWLQVAVGLGPLSVLRTRLNAVRKGEAPEITGRFPDEVHNLVDDLNAMIKAQERSLERARTRAGDLAHGLRTPIAALNAIARELRADGRARPADEIGRLADRMQAQVGRELARTQIAGRRLQARHERLRPIVEQLVDAVRRAPGGDALIWQIEISPETDVSIDRADLYELIGNLLDNALKWAKSRIRVSADHAGRSIVVEDDGPGIADDKLHEVVRRGVSLDRSPTSTGAGLSIVSDIAEEYGLKVDLTRSDLGGLRIEVRPAEAAAAEAVS